MTAARFAVTLISSDNTTYHAFTWTAAGGMVDLGTADGHSTRAWAINSAGDLAGDSGAAITVLLVA